MPAPLSPQTRPPAPRCARQWLRPAPLTSRYLAVVPFLQRAGFPALRLALGIVYLWFGALKVAGVSPVAPLVDGTVAFLGSPSWFVPALGAVEVAIGIWLLAGYALPFLLPIFIGHLIGTFAVFITRPGAAFRHGNPLELTTTGEFVIKNLVLLAAGIVVLTRR